ncbi:hypothetical protein OOK31_05550 [Streptomyces sp. NBC_00249]|nr:hypothetical protein [Streptomyces sp. NBC_00249]MCX5193357.1 hypothetical protein [Streptomyces sp. NBC_00249]
MSDEGAVDDGDPLGGRYVGQRGGGVLGIGDRADVEPEGPELVFKR